MRGIVVKINLTDFTRVGNLTLESDESYLVTAVLNGDYAYFGYRNAPKNAQYRSIPTLKLFVQSAYTLYTAQTLLQAKL